ncbi:hypothetical protein A1OE_426 [Candidatus Endolissoclinum faulkneri L2]|uniref:Uncharacterized protein n=1 Tax=Candidatus Endolissoclinum faulkneri L2 TaxID=1193729 RepID=K7YPW7_9PROT|nr:hypothetical protein A1OE_426 [Candidatus Endolissoclinum faulkneri L2]
MLLSLWIFIKEYLDQDIPKRVLYLRISTYFSIDFMLFHLKLYH